LILKAALTAVRIPVVHFFALMLVQRVVTCDVM
jgi:hypothetical protein